MADATDVANAPAPAPNSTLYVQNLNERIKVPVLKQSLEALFSTYGPVLSVVAHSNLRMRGQAFISFGDTDTATRALEEVNGFPLYGKGMVRICLPAHCLRQNTVGCCRGSEQPRRPRGSPR